MFIFSTGPNHWVNVCMLDLFILCSSIESDSTRLVSLQMVESSLSLHEEFQELQKPQDGESSSKGDL